MTVMKIITRKQAKALGLKRYFTGRLCSRGHRAERHVSGYNCIVCQKLNTSRWKKTHREIANRQLKSWIARNYEKHMKRRQKWRDKNRSQVNQKAAEWRARNRERLNSEARQRRRLHGEKIKRREKLKREKVADLVAVIRAELPELAKELGL